MKVKITNPRGTRTVPIEDALTPSSSWSDGGSVESAQADATAACNAMGRLLTHFVETGTLTLDKALEIAGNYFPRAELVE